MKLLILVLLITCFGFTNGHGNTNTLLGGLQQLDLNSVDNDTLKAIAEAQGKALELMNDVKTEGGTTNAIPLQVKRLLSVKTQLVAGVNYFLDMEIFIDDQLKICSIVVSHLYPWDNGGIWQVSISKEEDPCYQFMRRTPQNRSPGTMVGGAHEVDTNDVMVQQAVVWAIKHINKMSNSPYMQSLLKVARVTQQVVNGLQYHFKLTTVSTSCRNKPENHNKTLQECPAAEEAKPQDCDISVVYSLGVYTMESLQCQPSKAVIGRDGHDYFRHRRYVKNVKNMNILGGDTHDYISHGDEKCAEHLQAFREFRNKHNRVYGSSDETNLRFKIFCDNMEKVKIIQAAEQGSAQYGATVFADISEEEFRKLYLGFKAPITPKRQWPKAQIPNEPIPESWDWRDHNAVTSVKNQGGCGSCWAFSTTGNIEGQWALKSKNLLSLSEQELVDCDKLDQGCNGGYMYDAYEAIIGLGGIETESEYKYTGQDQSCQFNKSEVVVKLTGAVNISKDEGEMAAWLYKNGPIAIGINAIPMQFYLWGIAHPWKFFCDPNALDHGVLIVGYGKKGKEPYWIIKNSWGPHWGREGYYYIYRGDGSCGLNTMCSSAVVE
uniref:Cathepsin F n=1 Tax=Arion vulgaris TaxID=1028688 RepID=A0A0B7ATS0_9EUPU